MRHPARPSALAPAALAALAGCHLLGGTDGLYIVSEDPPAEQAAGGGAGAANSSSSGTAATGGSDGGARPACEASECPGEDTECSQRTCINGECAFVSSMPGTPCTDGGTVCDGGGRCVECLTTAQCTPPALCLDQQCRDPSCGDGIKNGGETAVDCGGECVSCDNDQPCMVPSDCKSNICQGGFCLGCSQHGDCPDVTWYCEPGTGFCRPKKGLGAGCEEHYECLFGYCGVFFSICGL